MQNDIARYIGYAGLLKQADAMRVCSHRMNLSVCGDCGKTHIQPLFTCKMKICPSCQLRKSRKTADNGLKCMIYMQEAQSFRGASLKLMTLTQLNCPRGELSAKIDEMLKGLSNMRFRKDWRDHVIGYCRAIEVTYNASLKSWHPHVHVLLILHSDTPQHMHENWYWRRLWADLMPSIDYEPVCDIKDVLDMGAVREVSKYVSKVSTIIDRAHEYERPALLAELYTATLGRRMMEYGGLWRVARRKLKILTDEAEERLDMPLSCEVCSKILHHYLMEWTGSAYKPEALE